MGPSVEQLSALLLQIEAELADEAHSEAEADEFAAEFAAALQHTREVAVSHQEGLVNSICDIFVQINGKEATVQDLSGIFGRVRDALAQEAEERFVDIDENDSEDDSDDADSNYNPDSDAYDYSRDAHDDEQFCSAYSSDCSA